MKTKKTFLLDTNVILTDADCIFGFEEHDIIIPFVVLSEVDGFKKKTDSLGYCAREFGRKLDELRQQGSLQDGVRIPGGGKLTVVKDCPTEDFDFLHEKDKNDNILLSTAIHFDGKVENLILVTKDILLRVQADSVGVKTEDYRNSNVTSKDIYQSSLEYSTDNHTVDELHRREGWVYNEEVNLEGVDLEENEYATLRAQSDVLVVRKGEKVHRIGTQYAFGVSSRNREQHFAMDALLDPQIKLVALTGAAGTGKTLLSVAAGLQLVTEEKMYDKMLVSKPVIPVGKDIGFLPGDMREKMDAWLSSFYDNFSLLMKNGDKRMQGKQGWEQMEEFNMVEVQALSHIRGRSISDQFVILDEAQNLNPLEIKTLVTRAGEGTKVVLLGDTAQIDNPYLDEYSNGLAYVIDKFRGNKLFAHVHLTKGERSELAETAAALL